MVDESLKESLVREIYRKRRTEVGDTTASTRSSDVDDEDLLGYESIAPGLPPASSDRRKWWLNNGLPARSRVAESRNGYQINPKRPSNPFVRSDQLDWIATQTTSRLQDQLQLNHPAEEPNELPQSPSHVLPRPYNTNIQLSLDSGHQRNNGTDIDRTIHRRTGSTTSSASSSTGFARKPAPPVPRKPVTLTSSGSQVVPTAFKGAVCAITNGKQGFPASPITPKGTSAPSTNTGFLPLPRSSTKTLQGPATIQPTRNQPLRGDGIPTPGETKRNVQPRCPPRSGSDVLASHNLLDDDGDTARSIPSLEPFRPG
ncbi:MAG: hypothetical protein Q9187_000359 [Circinaria calcarea]